MITRLGRPLRVVVFADHFSPESSGGVERVVWEVYRRLARSEAEVLVITALPASRKPFNGAPAIRTHVSSIWDLSPHIGVQAGLAPSLFRASRRLIDEFKPDVLHANGLHFQSTLAGALANHDRRHPMVFTSHVGKVSALQQPARALTEAYELVLGRYILSRCERYIAVSSSVRDHLQDDLGIDSKLIDDIPNGVDHSRFFPRAVDDADPAKVPLVMYLGRHIWNKGPQVLIEALRILRDQGVAFRAEFLSTGPLTRELQQRVDDLRLRHAVAFLGHVPDVAVEMRRADIIVRPSFTEGMPLGLLEAMATGVPLVVTNVSGNFDLIQDEINGLLVPPGGSDQLAEALKRLIFSPKLRKDLSMQALSDSYAYSWDACAAATLTTLHRAAARQGIAASR